MQPESKLPQVYSREEYATKQFWDSRYREKQSYFDWYAEFPELKQTFEKQYGLTVQDHILMLGCGNSKLSQQMYEAGYHNILNVDISPAVIQQMARISIQKGYQKMKWQVMDATNMHQVETNSFDVVIDKGTLDALISGKNIDICTKMLRQSMRVLKKQGQFILVTYGSPEGRKKFFQQSIGLNLYDYYFTKVDLSNMSTLINLMRSNLGNKPLSNITKDTEAMKKSLMQFNLLKVLRRNRKNEKKFIIWTDFSKLDPNSQQTESIFEQEQHKQQPKQEKNISQNEDKVQNSQPKQKKINYAPKKQSFCYVYSIRRKFANDIHDFLAKVDNQQIEIQIIEGNKIFNGDKQLTSIGIYSQNYGSQIQNAAKYLKFSEVSNNPFVLYSSLENFEKGKEEIKFAVREGEVCTLPAASKSVFIIQFQFSQKQLILIEQAMKRVCCQLVEKGGLEAHPSPKNYAYFGILMQKMGIRYKYSEFLNKHWYPSYQVVSISNSSCKYKLSIAPTLDLVQAEKIISQQLNRNQIKGMKNLRVNLNWKGYLNYYDPRVITLVNFCSMTYCQGAATNLIVEQYNRPQNEKYATNIPTIFIKKQSLSQFFARFLSAV